MTAKLCTGSAIRTHGLYNSAYIIRLAQCEVSRRNLVCHGCAGPYLGTLAVGSPLDTIIMTACRLKAYATARGVSPKIAKIGLLQHTKLHLDTKSLVTFLVPLCCWLSLFSDIVVNQLLRFRLLQIRP